MWLLNMGGLLIEVIVLVVGVWDLSYWLAYIEVTCQIRWLLAQAPLYVCS